MEENQGLRQQREGAVSWAGKGCLGREAAANNDVGRGDKDGGEEGKWKLPRVPGRETCASRQNTMQCIHHSFKPKSEAGSRGRAAVTPVASSLSFPSMDGRMDTGRDAPIGRCVQSFGTLQPSPGTTKFTEIPKLTPHPTAKIAGTSLEVGFAKYTYRWADGPRGVRDLCRWRMASQVA
jgi:hypothetical protein